MRPAETHSSRLQPVMVVPKAKKKVGSFRNWRIHAPTEIPLVLCVPKAKAKTMVETRAKGQSQGR